MAPHFSWNSLNERENILPLVFVANKYETEYTDT